MVGVAMLLFARTPVDGNYLTDLLPPFLLVGIGIGTAFPSLLTLAMSGAGPSDAGLASGVVNTSLQVGGAIGLAVLATLASERTDALQGSASHLAALNSGYHLAYLIGAALVGAALVIAVTVLRAPAPMAEPAEPTGQPAYSEAG
jgi:MFS family permease